MSVKEAYQDKADAQLCEWQAWIEQYKARAVTTDYQRIADRLDHSYWVARVRLDELCGSADDHWEYAKQAVERAMIDLKSLLDESGAAQNVRSIRLQPSRAYVYEPFRRRG